MIILLALAAVLLFDAVQSSFYFLVTQKVGIKAWVFFNPCALIDSFYLLGLFLFFVFGNITILAFILPGLVWFALIAMVIFRWNHPLFQVGHIAMTLSFLLVVFMFPNSLSSEVNLLILGALLTAIYFFYQVKYITKNRISLEKVFPQTIRRNIFFGF